MSTQKEQIHELTTKCQLYLVQQQKQSKLITIFSKSAKSLEKQLSKAKGSVQSHQHFEDIVSARETVEQSNGNNYSDFQKVLDKFIKESQLEIKQLQKDSRKMQEKVHMNLKKSDQSVTNLSKLELSLQKLVESNNQPGNEKMAKQIQEMQVKINQAKEQVDTMKQQLQQDEIDLQETDKKHYEALEELFLHITEKDQKIMLILTDTNNLNNFQLKMQEINQYAESIDVKEMASSLTQSVAHDKNLSEDDKQVKDTKEPVLEEIKDEVAKQEVELEEQLPE